MISLANNKQFIISASHSCWEGARKGQKLWPATKRSPEWQNQHHFLVQTPASSVGDLPHCRFSFFLLWPSGGWSYPPPPPHPPLSRPLHFSECFSQMISRTSQGTKPLFFPLATLMKPLHSSSLLTQIWKQKGKVTLTTRKKLSKASTLDRISKNKNCLIFQQRCELQLSQNVLSCVANKVKSSYIFIVLILLFSLIQLKIFGMCPKPLKNL